MEWVGDAAYAVLAQQLDYRATPFTPRVGTADSSNPAWTVERVTLPSGYDNTSFALQLFLPTDRRSPSGVIFYLPHAGGRAGHDRGVRSGGRRRSARFPAEVGLGAGRGGFRRRLRTLVVGRAHAVDQSRRARPAATAPLARGTGADDRLPDDAQGYRCHAKKRLFELLGSPADQKKHVLFEAGHGNLPRFQVEKETLEWFDRHVGSADR